MLIFFPLYKCRKKKVRWYLASRAHHSSQFPLPPHANPSEFLLLAPLPSSQAFTVGRSWGLVLGTLFSISNLSPVTSFSTITYNSIYMSTTPKYVFTFQAAKIQIYIPNCLFNSASRCLIVTSKGTEHVGQITT